MEAQLKTAVQSQLDGVRTGLNQLHNALKDIRDIKSSLSDVNSTYTSISTLGEKLRPVREENSRHSQVETQSMSAFKFMYLHFSNLIFHEEMLLGKGN